MDQVEIDGIMQGVNEYGSEKYLALAAKLLARNKKIKVEIIRGEWVWHDEGEKPVFEVDFTIDGINSHVGILETIFRDYNRQFDKDIGIKPEMEMKAKIVLRLAYLLYKHKGD